MICNRDKSVTLFCIFTFKNYSHLDRAGFEFTVGTCGNCELILIEIKYYWTNWAGRVSKWPNTPTAR